MKKFLTILFLIAALNAGAQNIWRAPSQFMAWSDFASTFSIHNGADSLTTRNGVYGYTGIGLSARGSSGDTSYIGYLNYDGHKIPVMYDRNGSNLGYATFADSGFILGNTKSALSAAFYGHADTIGYKVNGYEFKLPKTDTTAGYLLGTNGSGQYGFYAPGWGVTGNTSSTLTDSTTNFIGSTFQFPFIAKTGNSERYRISSNGLHTFTLPNTTETGVTLTANSLTTGIGLLISQSNSTSNTGALLFVSRSGTISGGSTVMRTAYIGNTFSQGGFGTATALELAASGSFYNNALYVSAGNIGMYTSNPQANLHISGSSTSLLLGTNTTNGVLLSYSTAGSGTSRIQTGFNTANARTYIGTPSNDNIIFDGSGHTGIRTVNTTNTFSVGLSETSGTGMKVIGNSLTTGIGTEMSSTSLTTGSILKLVSTSTESNGETGLNVAISGANANATRTAYGGVIAVTNTGTTSTNVALSLSASGATTNTALLFPTNASYIEATGTGANGLVIKNLKNSTNTTVGGTAITIEIDIAGTPYYFLAYPTTTP